MEVIDPFMDKTYNISLEYVEKSYGVLLYNIKYAAFCNDNIFECHVSDCHVSDYKTYHISAIVCHLSTGKLSL